LEIGKQLPTLLIIQGPTASGKTKLAIDLALHFDTQIISADARQFYSEMTIGTAKPSEIELAQATHHFINSHSIQEDFTAASFAKEASILLSRLFETKKFVVLVGGSNMYIDALIDGLDDIPSDVSLKKELNSILEINGIDEFLEELKEKDPETYFSIDKNNPHRVLRAIEAIRLTGKKVSELKQGLKKDNPFNTIRFAIEWERDTLYNRINQRVDAMMKDHWQLYLHQQESWHNKFMNHFAKFCSDHVEFRLYSQSSLKVCVEHAHLEALTL
jgi:tRNA dimethylallyltransferase